MARVVLCDRCGMMGFAGALGAVVLQTEATDPQESENLQRELCPQCVGDIVACIETRPTDRDRSMPFMEPWRRGSQDDPARPALESAG